MESARLIGCGEGKKGDFEDIEYVYRRALPLHFLSTNFECGQLAVPGSKRSFW